MYDIEPPEKRDNREPPERPVVVYLRFDLGAAFRAAVQTTWWLFLGFVLGVAVHRAMTVLPMSH